MTWLRRHQLGRTSQRWLQGTGPFRGLFQEAAHGKTDGSDLWNKDRKMTEIGQGLTHNMTLEVKKKS